MPSLFVNFAAFQGSIGTVQSILVAYLALWVYACDADFKLDDLGRTVAGTARSYGSGHIMPASPAEDDIQPGVVQPSLLHGPELPSISVARCSQGYRTARQEVSSSGAVTWPPGHPDLKAQEELTHGGTGSGGPSNNIDFSLNTLEVFPPNHLNHRGPGSGDSEPWLSHPSEFDFTVRQPSAYDNQPWNGFPSSPGSLSTIEHYFQSFFITSSNQHYPTRGLDVVSGSSHVNIDNVNHNMREAPTCDAGASPQDSEHLGSPPKIKPGARKPGSSLTRSNRANSIKASGASATQGQIPSKPAPRPQGEAPVEKQSTPSHSEDENILTPKGNRRARAPSKASSTQGASRIFKDEKTKPHPSKPGKATQRRTQHPELRQSQAPPATRTRYQRTVGLSGKSREGTDQASFPPVSDKDGQMSHPTFPEGKMIAQPSGTGTKRARQS